MLRIKRFKSNQMTWVVNRTQIFKINLTRFKVLETCEGNKSRKLFSAGPFKARSAQMSSSLISQLTFKFDDDDI